MDRQASQSLIAASCLLLGIYTSYNGLLGRRRALMGAVYLEPGFFTRRKKHTPWKLAGDIQFSLAL